MVDRGPAFFSHSGRWIHPLDVKATDICIEDIVQSLSHTCRFFGHCREPYSVLEHSIRVSLIVPFADAGWGLLHDASEAYLGDIITPVKRILGEAYTRLEANVMAAVCERFGLPVEEPASVKEADRILLVTEQRDVRSCTPPMKPGDPQPLTVLIRPLSAKEARETFLRRFYTLFPSERPVYQAPSASF